MFRRVWNVQKFMSFKATPHNHRLKPLRTIHLQIFGHLSQIFLERRQPSCVKFRKPDEKSETSVSLMLGVSGTQWLCGVALIYVVQYNIPLYSISHSHRIFHPFHNIFIYGNKTGSSPKKDTHIEVLSHSISDLQSEVLWRFY